MLCIRNHWRARLKPCGMLPSVPLTSPLTRVGVVGDIHCQHEALECALDSIRGRRVESILALGDIVDGSGDADRCVELLREREVLGVRGNHDRWLLENTMRSLPDATLKLAPENHSWLAELPSHRVLETVAGRLLAGHGVGEDDMVVLRPDTRGYALQGAISAVRDYPDVRFVVGGHTHERMVRELGPYLFINAGCLVPDHEPCFAILDFESRTAEFFELEPNLEVAPGVRYSFN